MMSRNGGWTRRHLKVSFNPNYSVILCNDYINSCLCTISPVNELLSGLPILIDIILLAPQYTCIHIHILFHTNTEININTYLFVYKDIGTLTE